MQPRDADASLRVLARHQWVREHGTPRVTTLAGSAAAAGAVWRDWLRLSGRDPAVASTFAEATGGSEGWMSAAAARALAQATATPAEPIAILVSAEVLTSWLAAHTDRVAAFIAEGVIEVPETTEPIPAVVSPRLGAPAVVRARSLAELAMFDALEATPSTAHRFELNQSVSFHFGSRAAEVDLLSRQDELAIEVDGYHHFTDPEHYRRDRRKDMLLQAHGYVVLRFLAEDILADPRAAVHMVVELLGVKQGRRRPPGKG